MFTKVEFVTPDKNPIVATKEPFMAGPEGKKYSIVLHFQGHYGEPTLTIDVDTEELKNGLLTYIAVFNPFERKWDFCVPV